VFLLSSKYYDVVYGGKDYAAEARWLHAVIQRYHPRASTLLDVACGTGRHLEQLGEWYDGAGLDASQELLDAARRRCPGLAFYQADMVDFSVPGRFDVITCLFSSIAYAGSFESLRSTLAAMQRHLRPGGIVVIEPWFTPKTYWTGTITANFVDEPELKIAWMYTSERRDETSVLDVQGLVGTPEGVEHFAERHELSLFSDEQYREAMRAVGLGVEHDAKGPSGRGLYVGVDATR
jgi:ubiquinone/menaquinone biosynthesis C-methylase UbiE